MFHIELINEQEKWERFVNEVSPHTFLQSWEWILFQKQLGNKVYPIGIFADNELCGIAFVYKINAKRGTFLFCPHGPLIDWGNTELFIEFAKYLKSLGKKEKVDFIRVSALASISHKTVKAFKDFGFRDAPIHMMHPELAWILDITPNAEQLFSGMKKRTRYSIRKAKKDGVQIIKSSDPASVDIFYSLYKQTASRQKFIPFSKKYIENEFNIFTKAQKGKMFFANYNNETIATAFIIFSNGSASYHQGASIRKYNNITASELLQWEAILEAKNRGMKFYNFWGIAPEGAKEHPLLGITQFKKGFGGFSEEYLHCQDLILTSKYWINYLVEKLRKKARRY